MFPLTAHKRPLIMGIINITPDSFSGDGLLKHSDFIVAAIEQAQQMIKAGADMLDIGGESSRPGSSPISVAEECARVIPVIQNLHQSLPTNCLLSIDTTKAEVADQALQAGAHIINDISALQADPAMAAVISKHKTYVVLMDNRSDAARIEQNSKIGGQYVGQNNLSITHEIKKHLIERAAYAEKTGISHNKIIIDPGIGFGKTVAQNLELIRNITELKETGFPVLIGASRKSFIGHVLDTGVDERLEGTAALTAISAFLGADILRVHDVQFMARTAKMAAALSA
jgi:dihydropteroate synthase